MIRSPKFVLVLVLVICVKLARSDDYADLELKPGATIREITLKFRQLSMMYHPDKNRDPKATAKFQTINNAYHNIMEKLAKSSSSGDTSSGSGSNSSSSASSRSGSNSSSGAKSGSGNNSSSDASSGSGIGYSGGRSGFTKETVWSDEFSKALEELITQIVHPLYGKQINLTAWARISRPYGGTIVGIIFENEDNNRNYIQQHENRRDLVATNVNTGPPGMSILHKNIMKTYFYLEFRKYPKTEYELYWEPHFANIKSQNLEDVRKLARKLYEGHACTSIGSWNDKSRQTVTAATESLIKITKRFPLPLQFVSDRMFGIVHIAIFTGTPLNSTSNVFFFVDCRYLDLTGKPTAVKISADYNEKSVRENAERYVRPDINKNKTKEAQEAMAVIKTGYNSVLVLDNLLQLNESQYIFVCEGKSGGKFASFFVVLEDTPGRMVFQGHTIHVGEPEPNCEAARYEAERYKSSARRQPQHTLITS